MAMEERQKLLGLADALNQRVIGQPEAVEAAAAAVRRGRSGLADQNRPIACLLFTGPTGVGKTELCRALAQELYGDSNAMIRLDMTEYMEKAVRLPAHRRASRLRGLRGGRGPDGKGPAAAVQLGSVRRIGKRRTRM